MFCIMLAPTYLSSLFFLSVSASNHALLISWPLHIYTWKILILLCQPLFLTTNSQSFFEFQFKSPFFCESSTDLLIFMTCLPSRPPDPHFDIHYIYYLFNVYIPHLILDSLMLGSQLAIVFAQPYLTIFFQSICNDFVIYQLGQVGPCFPESSFQYISH